MTTRPGKKGSTPRSPREPTGAEETPIDDSGVSSILAGYESQTRTPQRVQQPAIRASTVEGLRDTGGLFDMQGDAQIVGSLSPSSTSFQIVEKDEENGNKSDADGSSSGGSSDTGSKSGKDKDGKGEDETEKDDEDADAENSSPAEPSDPAVKAMSVLARRMITLAERLDKSATKKKTSEDTNDKLRLSKISSSSETYLMHQKKCKR